MSIHVPNIPTPDRVASGTCGRTFSFCGSSVFQALQGVRICIQEQFFLKSDPVVNTHFSLLESFRVGLWYQQPRAPFTTVNFSVSLRGAGDEAIFYPVDVKHFPF